MVEEGKPAPEFELTSDSGETVSLSSLRGRPVVLYFYPKDDTRTTFAVAASSRPGRSRSRAASSSNPLLFMPGRKPREPCIGARGNHRVSEPPERVVDAKARPARS